MALRPIMIALPTIMFNIPTSQNRLLSMSGT